MCLSGPMLPFRSQSRVPPGLTRRRRAPDFGSRVGPRSRDHSVEPRDRVRRLDGRATRLSAPPVPRTEEYSDEVEVTTRRSDRFGRTNETGTQDPSPALRHCAKHDDRFCPELRTDLRAAPLRAYRDSLFDVLAEPANQVRADIRPPARGNARPGLERRSRTALLT